MPSRGEPMRACGEPGLSAADLQEMALRLAHTIRNPLATIKTSAQLITRIDMAKEETAGYLAGIVREVARIDAAIRDMEDYVRLAPASTSVTPVRGALEDAVRSLEQAGRDRITLGPLPSASVRLARDLLARAARELLDNALRFAPSQCPVTVGAVRAAGQVHIDVDDSGPGIAPHFADRIMRPFFSTAPDRSGLGLNRAERICQLGGGTLQWRPRPEGGCRFSLVLPEA